MAHQGTPPQLSRRTDVEPDDSDRDSGVWEDADDCIGSTSTQEEKVHKQDGTEENSNEGEDFTVFVAFQGNMEDADFTQKLDTILNGIPSMLDIGLCNLCYMHVMSFA